MDAPLPHIAFRPLAMTDLSQVQVWFRAPHALRWFGRGRSYQDLVDDYQGYIDGKEPIHAFVIQVGGRPIGLVNWERFGDFPEQQATYRVSDPDASNCDIVIGEPDALHRGLGARILRAFLREIVFADPRITSCVIDPHVDNPIAIRCYEKAGFRFVRTVAEDGEDVALYLMELGRDDLDREAAVSPFIRPGRADELELVRGIDSDACMAFPDFDRTLDVTLAPDHPYAQAEVAFWTEALATQRLLFACTGAGQPVGFATLALPGGHPLLEQISVRRAWGRRGLGGMLLNRAQQWSARPGALWLTTYEHVPWNRPWYERRGFRVVADSDCPPEIRAILDAERAALPRGDKRIVMVYRHDGS